MRRAWPAPSGSPTARAQRRNSWRALLKADQWSALVDMAADEEALIRYCSLDRSELELIQAKRVAHNRLGLAIQLCFLRHLGRALLPGEVPPAAMVVFVAQQIGVNPGALAAYGGRAHGRLTKEKFAAAA